MSEPAGPDRPTEAPTEPPRCICGHNRSTHMPRRDDVLYPLGKCEGVQNDYPCPCTRYEVRATALAGTPITDVEQVTRLTDVLRDVLDFSDKSRGYVESIAWYLYEHGWRWNVAWTKRAILAAETEPRA